MDLFILDAHSYRSSNDLPDTHSNKTLFGKEQLHWLETSLLNSNAMWKVVSDDDPSTIPDCDKEGPHVTQGGDNWSTDGLLMVRIIGAFQKREMDL
jgi:phosphodiesterase/alkaline phosphatase D-like protein